MIKTGSDINATNSWNLTPLAVSALKNNFGIVKKLLSYPNTDVNCKDDEGRTLVSNSVDNLSAESFVNLKFLIEEKGADVNICDQKLLSPMHYCCRLNRSVVQKRFNRQLWEKLTAKQRVQKEDEFMNIVVELGKVMI